MNKTEAEWYRVEVLLRVCGYKDPAQHATFFVNRGFTAVELLAIEARHGKFPVSSPFGPLVKKRTHSRYGKAVTR